MDNSGNNTQQSPENGEDMGTNTAENSTPPPPTENKEHRRKDNESHADQNNDPQPKTQQNKVSKTSKKTASTQTFSKKVTYQEICDEIDNTYLHTHTNNSNIVDIIGIYVKGQKILYTEAKTVCELRLSYLMLPSILFTVCCSIINLLIASEYGKPISSILNGAIAFILAVINYLKLDARAEAHRVSAYKYDKLVSYIEFQSGKQLFFVEANLQINDIITKIEAEIKEIKETNPFVLPEIIRYNFPHLTSVNVFTEVKKIENKEMIIKNKLIDVYQDITNQEELLKIGGHTNNGSGTGDSEAAIKENIQKLTRRKMQIVKEIIELQNEYVSIDSVFNKEINAYFKRNK
jgi:hypothetical protein